MGVLLGSLVPGCSLLSLPFPILLYQAMAAVDSEAVFSARALAMGISAPTLTAVRAKGWNTMASFAFACAYVPGTGDDQAFVAGVLVEILGAGHNTHADTARLRRLYFESHTLAIQDLRRRSERTDVDPVVKMPAEERTVRLDRLRARYVGHDITGELEPSHALTDLLAGMLESGQIRYVTWSSCTPRDAEVHGVKNWKKILQELFVRVRPAISRRSRSHSNTQRILRPRSSYCMHSIEGRLHLSLQVFVTSKFSMH